MILYILAYSNSNHDFTNHSRARNQGRISDIPQLVNTSLANKLFLPNKRFLRPEVTYQNDSPQDIYIVERRADMINPIWIKAMKK